MKTDTILLGVAAILCSSVLSSAQIAPQGQAAPQPRTQQPRADPAKATTLTGCLYHDEDYILADAAPTPDAPTAGLTTGRTYKVSRLQDETLKAFVGMRVELTGTIKPDNDAKPADRATNAHLPTIAATSIHEADGEPCPATPR